MATSHLSVGFFALFVCIIASSSSAITVSLEGAEDLEDLMANLSKEVTQLRDTAASLLEEHSAKHEAEAETNGKEHALDVLLNHFLRNRQSRERAVSSRHGSGTEGSATEVLDQLILDYYSTTPGGTVYTHWGRHNCTEGSELVYNGTTAGEYYSHTGGGANYVCLPHQPLYAEVETSAHGSRSLLYAAELETSTAPALQSLHDQTPTCAICRAPKSRPTKLMIPGRNDCPSSKWRLEYKGYLMSSLYTHTTRTDFICMDDNAIAVPGTTGSQSGAKLYMVEARCGAGGIQCGPYVTGYELSCAVCSI